MMRPALQFTLTLLIYLFSCAAISQENYDWKNVPIGGGGYITGMKIHPLNGEKRFYRTDVGGAYRWDVETQSMKQMVFSTNSSHYSVAGIALHPTNQNIVYLAVGRDCKTANTAILKSTDGGVNFSEVSIVGGVQFHFAANGGRTCDVNDPNSASYDPNTPNNGDKDRQGTPLAINPLNPNELYIGAREKGLWVLDLTTLVATQMNTSQIPTNDTQYSIRSVVFHPTLNYVYIAYPGHGVYVGNTLTKNFWNLDFPGGADYPQLLQATDISLSKNADYMLVACEKAGIMKATGIDTNNQSILWTELAGGLASTNGNSGYYTVDTSPHDNNVAVTVTAGWNHINEFQATTDAGESFRMVSGRVNLDDHLFKWRSDAFASHVSQIAFDPDDPNRLHYTSWFSTFSSDNWSPNSGGTWHSLRAQGHEEIVPTDLVAFPKNVAGNILMTGSGDHSGFVFDESIIDPGSFPTNHIDQLTSSADKSSLSADKIKKSASFSFSEKQPDNLAVILTDDWDSAAGALLTSSDGGDTWVRKHGYLITYKKSHIEFASDDPDSMVMLNGSQVRFTKDGGDSFIPSVGSNAYPDDCGLPFDGAPISPSVVSNIQKFNNNVFGGGRYLTADKELNCVFYFYSPDGSFNISSDGGETFGIISTDLPATTDLWNKTRLVSIPGNAGHLFINIQNNLWRTTNGGRDWSRVASVNQARALSFGAGFDAYPAIYIFGRLSSGADNHFYRSDDAGQSWIRINEHSEKEIWGDNKIIAGDRNIPGRLYATASGQGVVFGERTGNASDSGNADSGNTDAGNTNPDVNVLPENPGSGNTGDGTSAIETDSTDDNTDGDTENLDTGNTDESGDGTSETTETDNSDDNADGDTENLDTGNTDESGDGASETTETDSTDDNADGDTENLDTGNTDESGDGTSETTETDSIDDNPDGSTNVPTAEDSSRSGGGALSVFLLVFVFWTTLLSRRRPASLSENNNESP